MTYEKYFLRHDVPEKIKKVAIAIMQRFTITGICDGMYICNVIASTCGIGDGEGNFTGDEITEYDKVARALQSSYGCNIGKDDVAELAEILQYGRIDKDKGICGLKKYISACISEKQTCDSWRTDYLNKCINEARETLQFLERKE